MQLEGSCYCGAVRFSVAADAPVPYLRCYCSICRKTAGGGGYAINLGANAATLVVDGEDSISVFHARVDGEESPGERRFCNRCGSALWVWDPRWPELGRKLINSREPRLSRRARPAGAKPQAMWSHRQDFATHWTACPGQTRRDAPLFPAGGVFVAQNVPHFLAPQSCPAGKIASVAATTVYELTA